MRRGESATAWQTHHRSRKITEFTEEDYEGGDAACHAIVDAKDKRIADLECALGQAELDHKELVYDCRDHRIAKEKAEAELAATDSELKERWENLNERDAVIDGLQAELAALMEALHEIYGKACQAMNEDDDLYLYSFAKDARDIALEAATRLNYRRAAMSELAEWINDLAGDYVEDWVGEQIAEVWQKDKDELAALREGIRELVRLDADIASTLDLEIEMKLEAEFACVLMGLAARLKESSDEQ